MRQRINLKMRCVECGDLFRRGEVTLLACQHYVCPDCYTIWQNSDNVRCHGCDGNNPNCALSMAEHEPSYNDYGPTVSDADPGL